MYYENDSTREYSWEKKHYKEFLEDMIANINVKENELEAT